MKDFLGHGSNSKGSNSALTKTQGPTPPMPRGPSGHGHKQISGGGGTPVSSNAKAAQALMSTLKSTQAPVHPAMARKAVPNGDAE